MIQIVQGDCREVLKGYPDKYFQCMMTSPPYWGLRDYGVDGQLGLESTPEKYVEHMVEVFREVKRVLRDDGVCWLNLGDSYASGKGTCYNPGGGVTSLGQARKALGAHPLNRGNKSVLTKSNLKPKDLVGIPWRVAFALQADGWWLRSDIIWAKGISFCPTYAGSSMPESVQDRPSKSHEYIFLLTQSARYFYDIEAVKEPAICAGQKVSLGEKSFSKRQAAGANVKPSGNALNDTYDVLPTRNLRSVWTINPKGFPGAHFATFPTALVEPCLEAGTSSRGACPTCGSPWKRVRFATGHVNKREPAYAPHNEPTKVDSTGWSPTSMASKFWRPTCSCYDAEEWPYGNKKIKEEQMDIALSILRGYESLPTVPCKVLDPFGGAGTVGVVSAELNLDCTLIDLSHSYCKEIALPRIKECTDDVVMERSKE